MRRMNVGVLLIGLMLGLGGIASAGPKGWGRGIRAYPAGEAFCVSHSLVSIGSAIVIQEGRCYRIGLLRTSTGTFLAFLDPDYHLPPGQLVRLRTPAGPKLRGRIFYLVPVQTVAVIPVDSFVLVPIRVEDRGPQLLIVVTDRSLPRIVVRFEVRV